MKIHMVTIMLLTLSGTAFANTEIQLKQCSEVEVINHWRSLERASTKLDKLLASEKSKDAAVVLEGYKTWSTAVVESTKEIDSYFIPKGATTLSELTQKYIDQHIISGDLEMEDYPTFIYTKGGNDLADTPTAAITTLFTLYERDGVKQEGNFMLDENSVRRCEQALQCRGRTPTKVTACNMLAESWTDTVNAYKATIKDRQAALVAKYAIATEKSWERYHNEARYQYPWEKAITAWVLSEELSSDAFVNPPEYQYFFVRPWAAMEYVQEAEDGSQFKAAATVEWFGINRWQSCRILGVTLFNKACGISAVSSWSDRAGADDIGHGAMLHFDNQYSFGATWRSGDVGFFLTVDLLKALEDKHDSIKKWQNIAEEYL